jgi:hypothetical protein
MALLATVVGMVTGLLPAGIGHLLPLGLIHLPGL